MPFHQIKRCSTKISFIDGKKGYFHDNPDVIQDRVVVYVVYQLTQNFVILIVTEGHI